MDEFQLNMWILSMRRSLEISLKMDERRVSFLVEKPYTRFERRVLDEI